MRLPRHLRIQIADRVIRIVAPVMIISMLFASCGLIFMDIRQYHRLIPAGITFLAMIPAYLLVLRGKPLSGGILMIILMNVGLVSGMIFSGGLRAPAYIATLSCITLLVVLYGVRTSVIYTLGVLAVGALFIRLEQLDLIPKVDPPPLEYYLLLFGIFLFMQIWFISIPVRFLIDALNNSQAQGEKLKQAIHERQQTQKELESILNKTPDIIYRIDPNGQISFISDAVQKYGHTPELFLGRPFLDVVHPEDRPTAIERFHEKQAGTPVVHEYEIRLLLSPLDTGQLPETIQRDQWENFHVTSGSIYSDDPATPGMYLGVQGIARNITPRKKAEAALQKSERLFKLVTEHTSALVSIHDADGNYIFASPSHAQLGYQPEELIGKSGLTLVFKEDQDMLPELLAKARIGQLSKASLSHRLLHKKGHIHHFRVSLDGVFKSDHSLEKIIFVAEDITELRQAQEEKMNALTLAAESNKMALVGQIAGKMAHDFNNVLGVIMGNTELALLDCPHDPTKKTLELIFQQTLRGKNLTRNLVAFAKDQEPKQVFFPIEEKMELVLTLLKRDLEGITITRNYGHHLPELLADPGMMEHALVNLIQNSIHAVSLVDEPEITLRTGLQEGRMVMEVEDNGCGIPNEFLKDIFEPSFTLKGSRDIAGVYKPGIKGTGYGMANVKKYIEQHKGIISIDSEPEKGTRVTIRMPVIKKDLTDQEIAEIKNHVSCFGKYILVVEDEPAISDVQYRILTSKPCRHKVDIAGNGDIAMDLIDRNTYDCISLDYTLPGEHTGMDVYHHIRKIQPTVPILFISGNIEFLESTKSLKQKDPHIDHLSKPCMNLDYINSINTLLKS